MRHFAQRIVGELRDASGRIAVGRWRGYRQKISVRIVSVGSYVAERIGDRQWLTKAVIGIRSGGIARVRRTRSRQIRTAATTR